MSTGPWPRTNAKDPSCANSGALRPVPPTLRSSRRAPTKSAGPRDRAALLRDPAPHVHAGANRRPLGQPWPDASSHSKPTRLSSSRSAYPSPINTRFPNLDPAATARRERPGPGTRRGGCRAPPRTARPTGTAAPGPGRRKSTDRDRRSRRVLVLSGVMRREPDRPAGSSPRENAPLRGCGSLGRATRGRVRRSPKKEGPRRPQPGFARLAILRA